MRKDELDPMQRYLLEEEVENFQRRRIGRREFLHRAGGLIGAGAAASLLGSLGCQDGAPGGADLSAPGDLAAPGDGPAPGDLGVGVSEDDPAIQVSTLEIPHGNGAFKLGGYLATPKVVPAGAAGLLVIHENRAMTPYIKDVVRRWGKAGYVALGVDLLSRAGGTAAFPNEGDRPGALGQLTPEQTVADLSAGLDYLKQRADVKDDRLGVTGFCYGGGYTFRMATQRADLRAAVAFYGPSPPLEDVPKIKAAVLALYGGLDTRINAGVPALEDALKKAGVTYEVKIYDGADHAFHNDTGTRYSPAAAQDAWARAQAWMAKYL